MKRWGCLAVCILFLCFLLTPDGCAAAETAENRVCDASGDWAVTCDAMPGKAVLCRGTVEFAASPGYALRCRVSPGLALLEVLDLRMDGTRVNASLYTIVTSYQEPGYAFSAYLSEGAAVSAHGRLEITYTVYAKEDARDLETVSLEVTDELSRTVSGTPAVIRSHCLDVYRGVALPENAGQINPVEGVCLSLYTDQALRERVGFRQRGADVYVACSGECCGHTRHAYVMRTSSTGRIRLEGLPEGRYYISETRPAEGLEERLEPVEVEITGSGEVISDGEISPSGQASMIHRPMGSSGQTRRENPLLVFYRAGSRVLAVSLTLLVAGRRYYL